MRTGSGVYRFGPFELDSGRRRLLRDGEPVSLADRHIAILLLLLSNPGRIVSKDALGEAGWPGDEAVTDNSIVQAIKGLRNTLGNQPDSGPYIETAPRRGYRFTAPIERARPHVAAPLCDPVLIASRACIEGRAALETLDLDAIAQARAIFADALLVAPDNSPLHVGMANACVLAFESTRIDALPDLPALQQADRHAQDGCRLDPSSGEACATHGFVLHRMGRTSDAIALVSKAIALEPNDWHHYIRLAYVSWGERRLRAAYRVLALCPDHPLAYWFIASVLVARQAFGSAIDALRAGCAAQNAQRKERKRFNAVGLHLLHGLVLAATGSEAESFEAFARELALTDERQVYGRECSATTWYACGALHLRQGRYDDAVLAFHETLTRVAGYAPAEVGLAAASQGREGRGGLEGRERVSANGVDAAIVKAAGLTLAGGHHEAARLCGERLVQAPAGSDGWLLPVDPLIHTAARPEMWAPVLAVLRDRAV